MKTVGKTLAAAILLALSAPALAGFEVPVGKKPVGQVQPSREASIEQALALITAQPDRYFAAAGDSFVAVDVIVDADGSEHVRFQRFHQGLRVIGGDLVVHSHAGQAKSPSLTFRSIARPALDAAISADQAVAVASPLFEARLGNSVAGRFGLSGRKEAAEASTRLVIHARGDTPMLAYEVRMEGIKSDQMPTEMRYLVDAGNGALLDSYDDIRADAAEGTGHSRYSGPVSLTTDSVDGGFEMVDPTRGFGFTIFAGNGRNSGQLYFDADNVWGDGTAADHATAAVDAQYGTAVTWDYFLDMHGRNGIRNDGVGAYNRVNYGRGFVNAFWSEGCFCMTYGNGDGINFGPLSSLDIAAHEMTHGVTNFTANLIYSGESGGLNEATSDIFGTLVEFFADNASDPGDYVVGEKIYLNFPEGDRGLRYMYNPILDNRSPNCYVSDLGSLDVHYSSGVANRFFYLLAEGSGEVSFNGIDHSAPTCNGGDVSGIGRLKAGAIWYRALTVYMTENTDYAGARAATLAAAEDLYGAASAEQQAVAAAWDAVDVN